MATIEDFGRLDIRVGTVVDAQPLAGARKPSIRLWIDFGAPKTQSPLPPPFSRFYRVFEQ